jgi:CrcB protein
VNAIVAVFIGGGLGSLARYGMSILLTKPFATGFPYATLASNTISSLLIGLLAGSQLLGKDAASNLWKPLMAIGFCGGFSTFSAFSLETIELAKNSMMSQALLNGFSNLVLCLGATLAGMWIGRYWLA